MRYYMLKDIEVEKPQLLLHFEDDVQAKRAVQTALREPKSVYAQFPEKFVLLFVGKMLSVDAAISLLPEFDQAHSYQVCTVQSLLEVK